MSEKAEKTTSTTRAQKCLNEKYKALRVNVKSEKMDQWKAYAESKGMSMYALVHEMFEKAMIADGFKAADPETKTGE